MSLEVPVSEIVSEKKQATDPRFNMEPALIETPGTPYQREMAKFERPYVYRPFPKAMYRAGLWNGAEMCMVSEPQPFEFKDEREYKNAMEKVSAFNRGCYIEVPNESEMSKAFERGYRETPTEAVAHLNARNNATSKEMAHRNFDDRNLSEGAKREIAAKESEAGEPLAEIPRTPVRKTKTIARA